MCLCAIFESLSFDSVTGFFVHCILKNWATLGIEVLTFKIDNLINGIEMNKDVLWDGIGIC